MTQTPTIETCRLGIEGPNGEVANSTFVSDTSCNHTRDTFVNFQPNELFLGFDFSLELPVEPPNSSERHNYVEDFHFGIVEAFVDLIYYNSSGGEKLYILCSSLSLTECNQNVDSYLARNNPIYGLANMFCTNTSTTLCFSTICKLY